MGKLKEINKGTIVRTVAMAVALINQILSIYGKSPIPFDEEQIETWVSTGITGIVAIWTWWKNNSFTKEAIQADHYKESIKENKQ